MIKELINQAVRKAGDKSALARTIKEQRPRISEYETHKRPPTDTFVLKLADYLGLDKGKTLYEVKKEIDPENAYLWQFMVRSAGLEPTPQASETYNLMARAFFAILSLLRLHILTHSPNARNASLKQYPYAQAIL